MHYICLLLCACLSAAHRTAPKPRSFAALDDSLLDTLLKLSDPAPVLDYHDGKSLLAKILIPRAPGTANLTRCQALFKDHFESLSTTIPVPSSSHLYDAGSGKPLEYIKTWSLEEHRFKDSTPYGEYTFTNQIFTHDPTAPLRLILAAHVDSKYFPSAPANQFVGATDSAAPVAIILEAAKALTPLLNAQLNAKVKAGAGMKEERITLQVVLLDGEEAFKQWTATDSIYGARALAEQWSQIEYTPSAASHPLSHLSTIQAFILLDLLGAPSPQISNYWSSTAWMFDAWLDAERRLGEAGLLWPGQSGPTWATASSNAKGKPFFTPRPKGQTHAVWGHIEDDHIPFLHRGVPILHLIASPFPRVWHTLADDASALDLDTIKAWAWITEVAVAEYLGLGEFVADAANAQAAGGAKDSSRRKLDSGTYKGPKTELVSVCSLAGASEVCEL